MGLGELRSCAAYRLQELDDVMREVPRELHRLGQATTCESLRNDTDPQVRLGRRGIGGFARVLCKAIAYFGKTQHSQNSHDTETAALQTCIHVPGASSHGSCSASVLQNNKSMPPWLCKQSFP